ncbi:MAG: lipocalin family protein [Bacteroidales bacterium]|nr:lipocalin family protein [Bacteroidales bacterium]
MSADYFNSPLMPYKWYVVACTVERRLFKNVDVFMYLSVNHDNAFELLYVATDEINRHLTKCYHGRFVIKKKKNYLIIRHGLWRKKFLIIAQNDDASMVALSNRRKSKIWVLSKKIPYDNNDLGKLLKSLENQGFDINSIELFYS